MSTYTMSHQELEHMLRRQAKMIADFAIPEDLSVFRDAMASQWADKCIPVLLASIGVKGKE